MKIIYVGLKQQKADNVAGTGLVWTRGQIHEVEDAVKAAKLLEHPLIWQDADSKYEMVPEPKAVAPSPRVSIIPQDSVSPYWEPVVMTVPEAVFVGVQKKELVAVFMTNADADRFADWKLEQDKGIDTSPKITGPKAEKKTLGLPNREQKQA